MLWVITWIRLGSARNSKHASAQLSASLPWGVRRTDWKSWTLLRYMLILLRSKVAPPPTPAGLLTMIMKTYCSEMSQSVQLKLHHLCVSLRVSAWMCVKKSGRLGAKSGRWCCGWHGLSVAVSPISPLSYLLLWQRTCHLIHLRSTADWAAARVSGEPRQSV